MTLRFNFEASFRLGLCLLLLIAALSAVCLSMAPLTAVAADAPVTDCEMPEPAQVVDCCHHDGDATNSERVPTPPLAVDSLASQGLAPIATSFSAVHACGPDSWPVARPTPLRV